MRARISHSIDVTVRNRTRNGESDEQRTEGFLPFSCPEPPCEATRISTTAGTNDLLQDEMSFSSKEVATSRGQLKGRRYCVPCNERRRESYNTRSGTPRGEISPIDQRYLSTVSHKVATTNTYKASSH